LSFLPFFWFFFYLSSSFLFSSPVFHRGPFFCHCRTAFIHPLLTQGFDFRRNFFWLTLWSIFPQSAPGVLVMVLTAFPASLPPPGVCPPLKVQMCGVQKNKGGQPFFPGQVCAGGFVNAQFWGGTNLDAQPTLVTHTVGSIPFLDVLRTFLGGVFPAFVFLFFPVLFQG